MNVVLVAIEELRAAILRGEIRSVSIDPDSIPPEDNS